MPTHTMPRYYEQVCSILDGEKNIALGAQKQYTFDRWKPNAVIVNLGSNEGFALDSPAWTDPEDGKIWKLWAEPDGTLEETSGQQRRS